MPSFSTHNFTIHSLKYTSILQLYITNRWFFCIVQCKPEQVQVVRDNDDPPATPGGKRDRLQYSLGDVITVLDKRCVGFTSQQLTYYSTVLEKSQVNNEEEHQCSLP